MALRAAVVGGGLGGLAAALFLRDAGLDVRVYEQMSEHRELGAGIVVAPNMVRPLARLGLAGRLPGFAVRLEAAWEIRRWEDGRVLSSQPMGEACLAMYGAHCYVAHRADLLGLFLSAWPADRLHLGHRCTGLTQHEAGVELNFVRDDGSTAQDEADVVIGADGIHSALRPFVAPEQAPRFSGLCAFRCLVPAADAPAMALRPVQTLWLGPQRHFVHYPISAGSLVNVVAIVPAGDWRDESWTAEGDIGDLMREFDGWDGRLHQLIASARQTRRWALFDREPIPSYAQGRVALLGDAAHPMLPFFAQGSTQAVEDAVVLAACLRGAGRGDAATALQRYDALRRPRASRVQTMSRGREVRNHLPDGPLQRERDAQFASGAPLRDSAWLYGHDVTTDCD